MKSKLFAVPVLLVLALLVFAEVIAPQLAESTVAHRLENRLGTRDVTVSLASRPNALLLLGQVDHAHVTARGGRLGEVLTSELALDGAGIKLDTAALLHGDSDEVRVVSAENLTLTGVITEDNLRELLARKFERLENASVKMTPETITVTGNVKVLGRTGDLTMQASVLAENGQLLLHLQSLSLTNTRLGSAKLSGLFGDLPLVRQSKLPFGAKFTDVQQQAGKTVITAEYDANAAQEQDVLAPYYE